MHVDICMAVCVSDYVCVHVRSSVRFSSPQHLGAGFWCTEGGGPCAQTHMHVSLSSVRHIQCVLLLCVVAAVVAHMAFFVDLFVSEGVWGWAEE